MVAMHPMIMTSIGKEFWMKRDQQIIIQQAIDVKNDAYFKSLL